MSRDFHERTRQYFGESIYKGLREYPILVIGAGAVGNEVVKHLVMLGIQKIYLIDFDIVEPSNLNRCVFFTPEDCIQKIPKVLAIQKAVELFYPDTKIVSYVTKIEDAPENIWKVPLVMICVDNNYTRYLINAKIFTLTHIPYIINGAIGRDFYELQVLQPKITACLCCLWSKEYIKGLIKEQVKCDKFFVTTVKNFPSISVITSLIGGLMATEAIKILAGLNQYKKNKTWLSGLEPYIGQYIRYNICSHESIVGKILKNSQCIEFFCQKNY